MYCIFNVQTKLKVAVLAKVTYSEFSNVQVYVEGTTRYMISAVKFHEMHTTKPTIQQKVLSIFEILHLKQVFCGFADEVISITGKHNRA